ncbi:DNase I-like protein [Dichomitus squalens]|uniref:DNase I-like protein n=1 Tax=Dichomitus squalens TaxID=114155 RepID=A0A4Q9PTW0_9APHY|nr:DNase I-like protein [Dichomitus squalens]
MSKPVRSPTEVAQDIIRPTEEVKVAIDARTAPRADADSETWTVSEHEPPVPRRKILAVVSHLQPNGKHEQGCVFVLLQRPPRIQSIPDEYVVEHAFPVLHNFSISMAQPRQTTVDLSSPPPGSTFALDQPKTELTVTIKPGEDTPFSSVTLHTTDTQGLRLLLDECRRLKEASTAETDDDYDFEPFAWIAPYVADHAVPPLLSSIPPDLRKLQIPVHARLSPASAGVPGSDLSDVEAIREDWLRERMQKEIFAVGEKARLKIRIGTFNVNGKLPSQDLSAWVRDQITLPASALIPPLKEISPLSIGEDRKNPIEEQLGWCLHPGNTIPSGIIPPDSSSLAASSDSSASGATVVDTISEDTTVSDQPPDVPEDPSDPDMLVLGFQELDLSAEALLYSTGTAREDNWCMAVFAGLGEKAVLYEKLASKQLVGMLLVIIIKKRLRPNFTDVRTASVGAGIMGIMGNKGATAIRVSFTPSPSPPASSGSESRPTALAFVNAHLAAFDEMYEKRNVDFHDLCKRLVFDYANSGDDIASTGSWYTPAAVPLGIFDADALFWLVNLNYRLLLPDADVRSLLADYELRDENFRVLRRFDQLTTAMRSKKAFDSFIERPITHLPSYRFGSGMLTDGLGYDMKRKPAWTDRILHMTSRAVVVKQESYTSHPAITMSDHRPVSAAFELEGPAVSVAEYESFMQRVWREVSGIEYAEERPRLRVTPNIIDFARIGHKRTVTRTLEVANIGKVPCAFRFVSQNFAADACPSWLRIEAMAGLVLPGKKTEIILTAYVDDAAAAQLNLGNARLEDTLVLHTALGRDYFVAVSGDYDRTCFATSIAWLVRLPGPVRALQAPSDLLPEDKSVNAPREIMRLINWLMSNGTQTDGLFLTPGDEELVLRIREDLDTGEEFSLEVTQNDSKTTLAFADTLLRLLESLTDPVIPSSLHAKCAQITSRDEAFEILDQFPVVNINVWISLTAFLHFIGQRESYQTKIEHLIAIFTSVLLRDDLNSLMPVSITGKRNFLRYFIG